MEYESRRFYGAFGLSFSLAGVTDALVDRALRKQAPNATAAAAANNAVGGGSGVGLFSQNQSSAGAGAGSGAGILGAGAAHPPSSETSAGMVGAAGWAEESRRVEAGEVLTRRGLAALKVSHPTAAVVYDRGWLFFFYLLPSESCQN